MPTDIKEPKHMLNNSDFLELSFLEEGSANTQNVKIDEITYEEPAFFLN